MDEQNVLAIRTENPAGRSSRWYPGGGLYRNVWLTKVKPTHVAQWGTFVTTRQASRSSALVDLVVEVENTQDEEDEVSVETEIHDYDPVSGKLGRRVTSFSKKVIELGAREKVAVNSTARITRPRLWGPPPHQKPNLYATVTRIYRGRELLDVYQTEFGVRSIEFTPDNGLLVNGEHVPLQGVNQHHDLGAIGAAFNVRAAQRQLEILQSFGVNAIRMSHNPPAPELLQLTDRMGFLVINEIFDCWYEAKTPLDFHLIFEDWHEPDLRSFIRRDRNHPSVFVWGYGNEVKEQDGDDEFAAEVALLLRDIVASEDPTRPGTISMHFSRPDMALPATQDVISLNYQGEGMRYGPGYEHITSGNKKTPQYQAYHDAFPEKLIMGSEVGSSLSTRGAFLFPVTPYNSASVNETYGGNRTTTTISAYELYSAEAGSSADRVFATQDEKSFVSGGFVWTGFDYLGEPYRYNGVHTGGWGIIDLAGFPKERYWLYQSRWRPDLEMAHIIPHWNWPGREGQVTPVHVFSSGDEAELFINGKSKGRLQKAPLTYRFRWDDVVYEPGEVHVQTYKNGKKWAVDTIKTTGAAARLEMQADRNSIVSDGDDLSFVTLRVTDDQGDFVAQANNQVSFSITGPGRIVATDNGHPNDYTAYTSHSRRAFNGLALVIVQGDVGATGDLIVTANSTGLATARAVVKVRQP